MLFIIKSMATKIQKVLRKDLIDDNLTLSDVKKIAENLSEDNLVRIFWGGEYIDFMFSSEQFLPQSGSVRILNNRNLTRSLNYQDFMDLANGSDQVSIFINHDQKYIEIFDKVNFYYYTDYLQTINDLRKSNKVIVEDSLNVISKSGKRFKFNKIVHQLKYGNDFFEVDSLGTRIFKEMTEEVENMWKNMFKDQEFPVNGKA